METFLLVLRCVAGPLLGAVIGYFTNWLAVKMLFRPYYPKKIGKWRLPFTPGIIPRRKPALAKAIGKAVGEQLFTKNDLSAMVVSESAKEKVADLAVNLWKSASEKNAEELLKKTLPAEKRETLKENAVNFLSGKIYSAVTEINVGKLVAEEGVKIINQKKASLGMLAMFLSGELINSLAGKLSEGVNAYVEANGRALIANAVKTEFEKFLNEPLSAVCKIAEEEVIRSAAASLYEKAASCAFAELAESFDVCSTVEEKLNAMEMKDLEKLVLSVMKKELNAIVNLGALIGFILGLIMIVFNFV